MAIQSADQVVGRLSVTSLLNLKGSRIHSGVIGEATKTMTYLDAGKVWYCEYAGSVTVTLPANAYGVRGRWFIFINTLAQTLTVAAATVDTLVADGDVAADSVAFSTGSHQAGAMLLVIGLGATWAAINMSVGCTMTVATN